MRIVPLQASTLLTMPSVATIGMFDGVHQGHQQLIDRVKEEASRQGLSSMVITFDRPPRQVLDPTFHPELLMTAEEKAEAIAQTCIDLLVVLPFSPKIAALTAQQFMSDVLRRQLAICHLITGYDNRFGHNREESFDDYVHYGRALDMKVERAEAVLTANGQRPVSSSMIRQQLKAGDVGKAAQLLTRPYTLHGIVTQGEHIGHRLGFPTANLAVDEPQKLIPATGVYAVHARLKGEDSPRPAMMNIGNRPTFNGQRQTLEIHILDYDGDLYGQPLSIGFDCRLRTERRFDSEEALVQQLKEDRKMVLKL